MLQIDFENEILQRIKKAKLNRSLNNAVRKSIFTIERQAKIETPVDKWVLRNSYEETFDNLVWTLTNFREYWFYVHEWIGMRRANPFMQRALDKTERKVDVIFSNEITSLLESL